MALTFNEIPQGKKVFFASDFHLGAPNEEKSLQRELKIIRWLDGIKDEALAIFLVGDVFDFWFEYKHAIPKGFARFQGKLAELSDAGIKIIFFTGNHDMWMFDYFKKEFNIDIYRDPEEIKLGSKKIYLGHGDGLGPGDRTYKILKSIFRSPICQWLFSKLHPNIGIGIASFWSKSSRASNGSVEKFLGDDEWLLQYCKNISKTNHYDYYVFGHRHLPLTLDVNDKSKYINLGEWLKYFTYAVYDEKGLRLCSFKNEEKEHINFSS